MLLLQPSVLTPNRLIVEMADEDEVVASYTFVVVLVVSVAMFSPSSGSPLLDNELPNLSVFFTASPSSLTEGLAVIGDVVGDCVTDVGGNVGTSIGASVPVIGGDVR